MHMIPNIKTRRLQRTSTGSTFKHAVANSEQKNRRKSSLFLVKPKASPASMPANGICPTHTTAEGTGTSTGALVYRSASQCAYIYQKPYYPPANYCSKVESVNEKSLAHMHPSLTRRRCEPESCRRECGRRGAPVRMLRVPPRFPQTTVLSTTESTRRQ